MNTLHLSIWNFFNTSDVTYIFGALILSILSYVITRGLIKRWVTRWLKRQDKMWEQEILASQILAVLTHLPPVSVIVFAIELFPYLDKHPEMSDILLRISTAYLAYLLVIILSRVLTIVSNVYHRLEVSARKPLKGYFQLAQMFLYIMGAIIIIGNIILKKDVIYIFSGLGALAAVLLIVFKDTILSFVASIQIVSNDLIRRGDWIEMSEFGADGHVVDVALHVIKIQNFDKTITTIPTYKFMEGSFKNWRGMYEAGGRRIKRTLTIDQRSIRFLTQAEIQTLEQVSLLKSFFSQKRKELGETFNVDQSPLEATKLLNMGAYRAYATAFLTANPKIRKDMTLVVRHLQPTADGLPLEIYAYANETSVNPYEDIQADIFDHLLAVLPKFGLRVFQNMTDPETFTGG